MRSAGGVKLNVVGNNQVQKTIPIEVQKRTSCAPTRLRRRQSSGLSLIAKGPVPLIPIEDILSPLGDEDIYVPVVVDVTCAYSLPPAGMRQPCLAGDIFKLQATKVAIEQRRWCGSALLETIAVDKENIRQSIVVVVEDRDPVSGGLNDVLFVLFCAGDIDTRQAGLRGNVFIPHRRRLHSGRQWFGGRGYAIAGCRSRLSMTKNRA